MSRGQRAKLSAAEKRRRAARKAHRQAKPPPRAPDDSVQTQLYAYGGALVRLHRGRLEPQKVWSPKLEAYVIAKAPRGTRPLPAEIRRLLHAQAAAEAREAEHQLQRQRAAAVGIEIPDWGDPKALPSGAWA